MKTDEKHVQISIIPFSNTFLYLVNSDSNDYDSDTYFSTKMDPKHRKIIIDNLDKLVELTHDVDTIIHKLYEVKMINVYMVNHLKTYPAIHKRTEEFYRMMLGRGPNAFENLCSFLLLTQNVAAQKLLQGHKVDTYSVVCSAMDDVDLGKGDRKVKSVVVLKPNESVVVKKHPKDMFMDSKDTYRMRSNPRGFALIINIYKTLGRDDRRGSERDFQKLKELFAQLGFEIIPKENLTDIEIQYEITALKNNPKLTKVDCLVVFMMGHGTQSGETERSAVDILACNGKAVNTNWLASELSSSDFEGPKLFFFQACRTVRGENDGVTFNQPSDWFSRSNSTDESTNEGKQPGYGDTALGFSTIPGNFSMRDPEKGSWFVDIFCDVISKYAWKDDLDLLWSRMDEEMKKRDSSKGRQTMEFVKRSFSKKLYFNPHLFESNDSSV